MTLGVGPRLVLLALIIGLVVVGSTGCEPKPEPSYPQTPATSEPAPPPPAPPQAEVPPQTPAPTPPAVEPGAAGMDMDPTIDQPTEPQPPADAPKSDAKLPPRPEKVSDWKMDDFVNAKKENDPRLIEAVEHLGSNRVGDPEVAELLAAVLKFIKPEERPAEPDPSTATPPPSDGMLLEGSVTGLSGSGPSGPSQPAQLDPRTIMAAVNALAANNTDPARAVLRTIVTGELITDDDRTATLSAMQFVLKDATAESESLMLRVLIEPEKIRKPSGTGAVSDAGFAQLGAGMAMHGTGTSAPLTAEVLYEEAKQRVDRFGSESFRLKLAQYLLTSPQATVKQKEELGAMLQRPNPGNVAPQLLIYQAPIDAAELKTAMEKFFAEVSSIALGHVLGILEDKEAESPQETTKPAESGGWGVSEPSGSGLRMDEPMPPNDFGDPGGGFEGATQAADFHDPKVIYPLAGKLWDPKTAQTVAQRIAGIKALDPANTTLALARTMPVDRIRAGLYALLRAQHEDGPGQLIGDAGALGGGYGGPGMMGLEGGFSTPGGHFGHGGGVPGQSGAVIDPGFLLVVKMLPREDKLAPKTAKKTRTTRTPAAGGLSADPGADMLQSGAQVQADTPAEEWMDASENLLKLLCQQFERAAEGQKAAGDKPSEKMPVKPHPKANITARFEMKWPEDTAAKLSGMTIDPIEVHYARIDDTTQFSRLTKYYQRAAKAKPRTTSQNEAWFDLVADSETPGRTLSCDVLITRPQGAVPAAAGMVRGRRVEADEPLVVHILTIEMNDPTGGKAKAEPASSEPASSEPPSSNQ